MGKEFLTGYTELADGEKDPRNLMVAFAIDRVLCIEFDISDYVDVRYKLGSFPDDPDFFTDLVQHHLLLLPHHLQTAT